MQSSDEALNLLKRLKNDYPKGILLYLSAGCCEGSALLCYEKDDFKLGVNDALLASVLGVEIYTHKSHIKHLKDTKLFLETAPGKGSEYSLDYDYNEHLILKSEICNLWLIF